MQKVEFYIDKALIKCSYTTKEKGTDPEAPDFTVFNIDYTTNRDEKTFGPYPINIYVGNDIITIGNKPNKDSSREFLVKFKAAFMDNSRKTLRRLKF